MSIRTILLSDRNQYVVFWKGTSTGETLFNQKRTLPFSADSLFDQILKKVNRPKKKFNVIHNINVTNRKFM